MISIVLVIAGVVVGVIGGALGVCYWIIKQFNS